MPKVAAWQATTCWDCCYTMAFIKGGSPQKIGSCQAAYNHLHKAVQNFKTAGVRHMTDCSARSGLSPTSPLETVVVFPAKQTSRACGCFTFLPRFAFRLYSPI